MSLPGDRWCLEIGGDRKIMDRLIKVYEATDPWVFAAGEKYYITSTAMQQPMRWDRVKDTAEEQLKLIEGAFELVLGTKIVLQKFRLVPPIGTFIEPIRDVVRCDTLRRVITGEWLETEAFPLMRKMIDNGPISPMINEVLWYYANNQRDYFAFYKIYEIIRADCGGEAGLKQTLNISSRRLKRFTDNLNNAALSGKLARHARDNSQGRENVEKRKWSFREVEDFTREMIFSWVKAKCKT